MTDLPLSRVMEAEGPDRELFYDACVALGACNGGDDFEQYFWRMIDAGAWESAAFALVGRVLPGWSLHITKKVDASWACVGAPYAEGLVWGMHALPALAILAALIEAKATEEKQP